MNGCHFLTIGMFKKDRRLVGAEDVMMWKPVTGVQLIVLL